MTTNVNKVALEDLVIEASSTFADMAAGRRKGYIARTLPKLHAAADAIRRSRGSPVPVPALDGDSFRRVDIEAMLCVWEYLCDARDKGGAIEAAFEHYGTLAMRHAAMEIGLWAEKAYHLIPENVRDAFPYDWEIVPALVRQIDWMGGNPKVRTPHGVYYRLPEIEEAARLAGAELTAEA